MRTPLEFSQAKGNPIINFDFLVAGCNTRCQHCYVNGGPGPMMPLADALTCLERLDELAACLHNEVSFTLDHEPILNTLPGNRDYGAYYDETVLPPMPQLIAALEQLPQDLVYGDFESILYRGLTALNTPTRLL